MRRVVPLLGAAAVVLGICLVPMGTAAAFGAEQLECSISPSGSFSAPDCFPGLPSSSYTVAFEVFNSAGDTFSWTVPSGFTSYSGCGSTDPGCSFVVSADRTDQVANVSVVVSQGANHATLSATATAPATCPFPPNFAFC
jgi:hypothetical protein